MRVDPVIYKASAKAICKCGNLVTFHEPYPAICKRCGYKVYPSEKIKFKEKIKLIMRRNKHE